jgi:hypothetical protein
LTYKSGFPKLPSNESKFLSKKSYNFLQFITEKIERMMLRAKSEEIKITLKNGKRKFLSLMTLIMLLFIHAQPSWSQTGLVKNSANPSYYSWIQTSYNAASSEESLLMQAGVFTEDINLNKDIVTSLRGGYNEGFTSDSGFTVINGKVTISSGTVTMSNVKISTLAPAANSLRDDFNASVINASVWQVAGWSEHGGQTGAARCYAKDGFLTMEFLNDTAYFNAHGLYLSSAIQTWGTFLYGRWEARLKPSNVPGVLNSFYTIDWGAGSGTKQEIDIEFLTKSFGIGSGQVHYAVHAEGKTSFNTNPDVDLLFNPSADFHIYGFDITPTEIRWTVDGNVKETYVYSEHSPSGVTINAPYQLKLNAWSKVDWIGGPPAAGTVCTYLIDWIKFTPM